MQLDGEMLCQIYSITLYSIRDIHISETNNLPNKLSIGCKQQQKTKETKEREREKTRIEIIKTLLFQHILCMLKYRASDKAMNSKTFIRNKIFLYAQLIYDIVFGRFDFFIIDDGSRNLEPLTGPEILNPSRLILLVRSPGEENS